jgi:hypothetical protein
MDAEADYLKRKRKGHADVAEEADATKTIGTPIQCAHHADQLTPECWANHQVDRCVKLRDARVYGLFGLELHLLGRETPS